MNPDASVLALATIDIDIEPIAQGQSVTVNWRGNPVFIRHRTPAEIEAARAVPVEDLPDRVARNANLAEDAAATTRTGSSRAGKPSGADRHLHPSRLRADRRTG
jgi:ubiquinol-cytochrome c reductase iron-sulfur subunit